MNDATQKQVFSLMESVFGAPDGTVNLETTHDDVENWDSLNIINLMMSLEGAFGVSLDAEEAEQMLSTALVIDILESKGVE
ncbi:MAG: acyl carrier protein [Pseudohongiellaceae bacterium]